MMVVRLVTFFRCGLGLLFGMVMFVLRRMAIRAVVMVVLVRVLVLAVVVVVLVGVAIVPVVVLVFGSMPVVSMVMSMLAVVRRARGTGGCGKGERSDQRGREKPHGTTSCRGLAA